VNILGYTLNPNPNYNLTTELKNEIGSKKADGAILARAINEASSARGSVAYSSARGSYPLLDKEGTESSSTRGSNESSSTRGSYPLPNENPFPKALGVIELKGTDTKDLDKINAQAFNYKNNQSGCVYVITSNFEKLRFFIHDSVNHEEFNLFNLSKERFQLLWLCLAAQNLLSGLPLRIKEESLLQEDNITKQLYKDYAAFRSDLWHNMLKNNPEQDKLLLFKKTQKLLDRFLFILFAEDSGLLPPNSILKIITKWKEDTDWGDNRKLYDIYKQYFGFINSGRPAKGEMAEIFGYNGGLFVADDILDHIQIDDDILLKHTEKLTVYDFQSEVDVNILGHIFENSLNEIENITAEIEGQEIDKSKTKRKKDGVFYTPKYITKYIVDNTLGKLCEEKKAELNIVDEEYAKGRKDRKKDVVKHLNETLQKYRDWLLNISICDPACGSGAFLNQALEFLIQEHAYIDELKAQLLGESIVFQDISNHILEHNIFGVDINEESVEIAKLSLWLRTAQRGRKLTSLNNNIKCGNSLIDDPKVAGEKAFHWQKEFPKVFKEKEKQAFHITWVTHNSRTSQRMIDHKVQKGDTYWLEGEEEIQVAKSIKAMVEQDGLNVMALNLCGDHVHLLLVCEEEEIPNIVRKLKGKSSQELKEFLQIPKEEQFTLWAQKFSTTYINSDEQLRNAIDYIRNNRFKHELPPSKGLQALVESEVLNQDYDQVYRTEYKGGFDVVIGNPPYVKLEQIKEVSESLSKLNYETFDKRGDLYVLFVERGFQILKKHGLISFIMPNKWLQAGYGQKLREFLLTKELQRLIDFGDIQIFEGATTYPVIFTAKADEPKDEFYASLLKESGVLDFEANVLNTTETFKTDSFNGDTWVISSGINQKLISKLSAKFKTLEEFIGGEAFRGIVPGLSEAFIIDEIKRQELISKDLNSSKVIGSLLRGRDIIRYGKPQKEGLEYIILASFGSYKTLQSNYHAIYNHLMMYEDKLKKRGQCTGSKPTNEKPFNGQHHWLELDNNPSESYLDLYKKPKIMYQAFQVKPCFIYDEQSLYCNNSMWNISSDNKALLGILNSKMGWWLITKYCTQIQNGCQLIWKYFGKIPVPEVKKDSELTVSIPKPRTD
jgi:type I restriction-modification system DNA methylase subunit/REP element-mobilizing transposase RayT